MSVTKSLSWVEDFVENYLKFDEPNENKSDSNIISIFVTSLKRKVNNARSIIQNEMVEVNKKKQQVDRDERRLNREKDKAGLLYKSIADLDKELRDKQSELNHITSQLTLKEEEVNAQKEEMDKLKKKREEFEAEINSSKRRFDVNLQKRTLQLQKVEKDLNSVSTRIVEKNSRLEHLKADEKKIEEALNKSRNNFDELQEAQRKREDRVNRMRSKIDADKRVLKLDREEFEREKKKQLEKIKTRMDRLERPTFKWAKSRPPPINIHCENGSENGFIERNSVYTSKSEVSMEDSVYILNKGHEPGDDLSSLPNLPSPGIRGRPVWKTARGMRSPTPPVFGKARSSSFLNQRRNTKDVDQLRKTEQKLKEIEKKQLKLDAERVEIEASKARSIEERKIISERQANLAMKEAKMDRWYKAFQAAEVKNLEVLATEGLTSTQLNMEKQFAAIFLKTTYDANELQRDIEEWLRLAKERHQEEWEDLKTEKGQFEIEKARVRTELRKSRAVREQ